MEESNRPAGARALEPAVPRTPPPRGPPITAAKHGRRKRKLTSNPERLERWSMNCHRVQQQLDAFADREIGGWKSRRITRHLARCAACSAVWSETQRLGERARA